MRPTISQEAVQEFQINRSSYNAEFGRVGGEAINIVSKSGGNQFRGSLFEYFRHETPGRAQRFRHRSSKGPALQAQPARLHLRRADRQRQDLLFRRLRGTHPARVGVHHDLERSVHFAADGRPAGSDSRQGSQDSDSRRRGSLLSAAVLRDRFRGQDSRQGPTDHEHLRFRRSAYHAGVAGFDLRRGHRAGGPAVILFLPAVICARDLDHPAHATGSRIRLAIAPRTDPRHQHQQSRSAGR